jgi:hypothetical protein
MWPQNFFRSNRTSELQQELRPAADAGHLQCGMKNSGGQAYASWHSAIIRTGIFPLLNL